MTLVDKRHGLMVNAVVSSPSRLAEVDDALCLLKGLADIAPRGSVDAGKGYDTRDFVDGTRAVGFTPRVAEKARGAPWMGARPRFRPVLLLFASYGCSVLGAGTTRGPPMAVTLQPRMLLPDSSKCLRKIRVFRLHTGLPTEGEIPIFPQAEHLESEAQESIRVCTSK